jgi:hypothetical protein
MKFAIFSMAVFSAVQAAEGDSTHFAELLQTAKEAETAATANGAVPANGLRTVTQEDMDLVNEYGCWCYFQDGYGSGKGKPVDDIDVLCKRLHDGYTCAIMDSADLGDECVPWEVSYNSAIGSGMLIDMDIATIRQECDVQNPDNGCPNWVCKIEGYFLQQLVLYFTHGGQINHNFRHAMGFNTATGCPVMTGTKSDKACCDEYPLRFPFKTYNGARDCCYTHTFNTNLYQCCGDGTVKMSC